MLQERFLIKAEHFYIVLGTMKKIKILPFAEKVVFDHSLKQVSADYKSYCPNL